MRVSKERAAHNRERILTSAARLFREQGIAATGVDAITDDAGLTHGGLYSQFGSKEAIAAEAIRFALARGQRVWQRALKRNPGKGSIPAIVESYLSRTHRDAPGNGCVVAALGTDIARQPRRPANEFARPRRPHPVAGVRPCGCCKKAVHNPDRLQRPCAVAGVKACGRQCKDRAALRYRAGREGDHDLSRARQRAA